MKTVATKERRPSVETLAEARRLFEEHRAYCRDHIFKYPKVPADTIKYYFHWYRWMLHDGRARNFDDFLGKILVHKELANGRFNFILYSYPFVGKKIKRSDEITIQVTTLIFENIEQAKLLFEQEEISKEDISHFLENKAVRVKIDNTQKNENSDKYGKKSDSSESQINIENLSIDNRQQQINIANVTNITNIATHNYYTVDVQKDKRTILANATAISDDEILNQKTDKKKGEVRVEKIKIPTKLFIALKKAGYIERSKQKHDDKLKYKWIKKASKNTGINKLSLFDFCDLMGYFKSKDTTAMVAFVNANFELNKFVESSSFWRYNQNKKSEFYTNLVDIVNKHKNT